MGGFVEIKPSVLKGVVQACLDVHKNYRGELDTLTKVQPRMFGLIKGYDLVETPCWSYTHAGISSRLDELMDIAEGAEKDEVLVHLSESTYLNLKRLELMSDEFQPFIFGSGY